MSEHIDDGSDKPLGTLSEDGYLEVRELPDGSRCWCETELGQHARWMSQAPDLFERYQSHLEELAQFRRIEASRVTPPSAERESEG